MITDILDTLMIVFIVLKPWILAFCFLLLVVFAMIMLMESSDKNGNK